SGWISVSVSEFHTVEVQSGKEVTLQCTNYSSTISHIFWFRLDNRPNISCISSMFSSDGNVSFCDGFKNGKFNMTSNMTTLFLQIKSVDSSDSGLYFCGSYCGDYQNVKAVIVSATYLKVQGKTVDVVLSKKNPHGTTSLSVILVTVTVPLIIAAIGVAVTVSKLQPADNQEQNLQQNENLDSEDLKDAALSLCSAATRSRRPASEGEVETRVFYTASR
ncbi:uncharacterized protein, partial [Trachinotus anak]|uniref:uncharacterized protein n=1 Tax=Trachinotus anak TaxID=443729 RepID=UPI0039F1DF88